MSEFEDPSKEKVSTNDTERSLPDNQKNDLKIEEQKLKDTQNDADDEKDILVIQKNFEAFKITGDLQETERSLPGNNQNDLQIQDQRLEGTDNVVDEKDILVMREKIKALKMITDLQDILIQLLQLNLKLVDIKSKILKNSVISAVEDIQKTADNALKEFLINSITECQNGELQEIMRCVASTNIQLEAESVDGIDKIVEETYGKCLMYRETYKKCKTILGHFLKNVENIIKICNTPRHYQDKVCILCSVFGPVVLHNSIHPFTKSAFNEFEILIDKGFNNPDHSLEDKLDVLRVTIEKAEIAYNGLKSIAFKILNFEYAKI